MTRLAPRLLLALAIRSLPAHRHVWAQAMAAEFEIAEVDGQSFSFALGCLYGAWQTMPDHGEGRFALASHAMVLGLLVPMVTISMVAALLGFPCVEVGNGLLPFLAGHGVHLSLLAPGTYAVAPALKLVMLLLTIGHLFLVGARSRMVVGRCGDGLQHRRPDEAGQRLMVHRAGCDAAVPAAGRVDRRDGRAASARRMAFRHRRQRRGGGFARHVLIGHQQTR